MGKSLSEVIALVKGLPEGSLDEAYERIKEVKDRADAERRPAAKACPRCGSPHVSRNGKRRGRQSYICKGCGRSFSDTTGAATAHSRCGETEWRQVISDTVQGVPIERTAEDLCLSHHTVFRMRHKILLRLEGEQGRDPVALDGVCEADETYVLENEKGRKMPEGHHRGPRRHGAVAAKRGISKEYVCICTGVAEDGACVSRAVNRASPKKKDILEVFGGRVGDGTLVLCDGAKSYNALDGLCKVATCKSINRVNGFHSFIKERNLRARGFATIYLNRYNALFSTAYARGDDAAEEIFALMAAPDGEFSSVADVTAKNLLML